MEYAKYNVSFTIKEFDFSGLTATFRLLSRRVNCNMHTTLHSLAGGEIVVEGHY